MWHFYQDQGLCVCVHVCECVHACACAFCHSCPCPLNTDSVLHGEYAPRYRATFSPYWKWKIASDEIKCHVIFHCCLGRSLHQRWTRDTGSHPVHRLMHSDSCQVESTRSDPVRDFRRNLCRKVTGAPVRVRSRRVRCRQINGKGLHVWKGLCCWQFATLPLLAV